MNDKAKNLLGVYTSIGDKVLSHYEIRERIGEGGLAQVYKAWDTRLLGSDQESSALGHGAYRLAAPAHPGSATGFRA